MNAKLPTAAKVIGILCLIGGLWNGILGPIALLVKPGEGSLLANPTIRFFVMAATLMGWYFVVFSSAFLFRKELGRRGLIAGFGIAIVLVVAYMGSMVVEAPRSFVIVGAIMGVMFWGSIPYLLIRYLMSESVRASVKDEKH